MDKITIEWEAEGETYIVHKDGQWIADIQDLVEVSIYALSVAEISGSIVILLSVNGS